MWIRKKEITELSDGIRKIMDGQEIDLRDNKEGVLSILKNDVHTLANREKEQRRIAQEERTHLSEYLTDISHQLKTPITSMSLMTDLLCEAPEEKQREFIFSMKKELAHMEWLVSALLKMAKLDSKTVDFIESEVSARELVEEAIKPLEILMDIKNQQVEVLHDVAFLCDRRWTQEALTNLLKNAMESSKEGGVIRVDSGENPLYTWLSITDAGDGIPMERMKCLFQRFENSQNENGYGVGLPLALAIVRGQNGDIEVAPGGNGTGATFTVKFYKS